MKARHRKILQELMFLSNDLGGILDGTSTNEAKYRDRQRALSDVYNVIYAVLADHPENDCNDDDWENGQKAIEHLKELKAKKYPDRKGNY